jgi:hypothetical protein
MSPHAKRALSDRRAQVSLPRGAVSDGCCSHVRAWRPSAVVRSATIDPNDVGAVVTKALTSSYGDAQKPEAASRQAPAARSTNHS